MEMENGGESVGGRVFKDWEVVCKAARSHENDTTDLLYELNGKMIDVWVSRTIAICIQLLSCLALAQRSA